MHGSHLIKSWASTQSVIALSSGEAEYYAMVKAATMAIGVQAIACDLGITWNAPIRMHTDASAAIGIASRIGLGKVRHIDVTQLWLQEKVSEKKIELVKVNTLDNLADALTKAVDAEAIRRHVEGIGAERRLDRHDLAPAVEASDTLQHESDDLLVVELGEVNITEENLQRHKQLRHRGKFGIGTNTFITEENFGIGANNFVVEENFGSGTNNSITEENL